MGTNVQDTPTPASGTTITRRELLQGTGALVVGFSLSQLLPAVATGQAPPGQNAPTTMFNPPIEVAPEPMGVDSYLRLARDGSLTIFTGYIDMGTGIFTALRQCVADELDVPYERTSIVGGDTGLTPDGGLSVASFGMTRAVQPLRVASAAARKRLLELAAERFGVGVDALTVRDGVVSVTADTAKQVTYGDLIGDRRFDIALEVGEIGLGIIPLLKVPENVRLKPLAQDNKAVGKSIPRFDLPQRVIEGKFCHNVRVPGMLHGRTVRPAAIGATLVRVDESSINGLPGLVKLVVDRNFVGVVCEREEQAIRAATRLKVEWSNTANLPGSEGLYKALRTQPPPKRVSNPNITSHLGDVPAALKGAARTLSASYEYPYNAHAMMAPTVAVADIKADSGTIWTGSQGIRQTQRDVARALGMPVEKLRLIWMPEAGSYGRLTTADAAADAALLSRAVGRPVRVQWSRLEEHAWSPHQPPLAIDLSGGLDARGNLVAWHSESWSTETESWRGNLLATRLNGTAQGNDNLRREVSNSTSSLFYDVPNVRSISHSVEQVLDRGLWMRMPGSLQRSFATESFLDELAAAARVDPIEFRLRYMKNPRGIRVLKTVLERSGWQTRPSPRPDASSGTIVTGRGVCVQTTSYANAWVAMVAEVTVNRDTGEVRVTRVVPVFDCQSVVNPDGLANQIEQSTLQGISRVMMEEVTFDRAKVTSIHWRAHPILTFSQVPKVDVVVINTPIEPRSGGGELCTGPAGAAIGNAIFDATGVRIRRIPFTPVRVKAALAAGVAP